MLMFFRGVDVRRVLMIKIARVGKNSRIATLVAIPDHIRHSLIMAMPPAILRASDSNKSDSHAYNTG
jgi:hypothetical protein